MAAVRAARRGGPPDVRVHLQAGAASTDRFLGTIAGTVPIPAFFADTNLARIVGSAVPAAA
ncbi:MAG: hypothetical protein JO023_13125 [Chloroflexi bacterium]|nr:hypothetical protein [Chloroflexota bacterium]